MQFAFCLFLESVMLLLLLSCGQRCRPCFTGAAFTSFASLCVVWRWQMKLWMLQ